MFHRSAPRSHRYNRLVFLSLCRVWRVFKLHMTKMSVHKASLPPSLRTDISNQQSSNVFISEHWCHTRHEVSGPSSRTSSPTPSEDYYAAALSTFPHTFRLVPCTLEEATAVVVVIPSSQENHPSSLLFTSHSLNRFRLICSCFTKGARLHPYRIAPSARRLSSSSAS
jgi:hypothetical protein